MKVFHILAIAVALLAVSCHGLNILAILPLSMKSHYAIGNSIVKSLLAVGHNVTSISMFEPEKPIENYRNIPVPDTMSAGWCFFLSNFFVI
jgi:hypothetical protein